MSNPDTIATRFTRCVQGHIRLVQKFLNIAMGKVAGKCETDAGRIAFIQKDKKLFAAVATDHIAGTDGMPQSAGNLSKHIVTHGMSKWFISTQLPSYLSD